MAGGEDLLDFENKFIVVAQIAWDPVTQTAQLAHVSIGTVTKFAFASMVKVLVHKWDM